MIRGKDGHTSSMSLAGVPFLQTSCRFRWRGDQKTIHRHRRHTCTSVRHAFSLSSPYSSSSSYSRELNISSRTSSGSASIDVTWPTSHRISQRSLGDVAQDVHRLVNSSPVQSGASFSAVGDPSERDRIKIGDPGQVGDDGWERASGRET